MRAKLDSFVKKKISGGSKSKGEKERFNSTC
jgi:hypothetical protein